MNIISSSDLISPREKDVLLLLAKGFTCKQISGRLSISETTVITHKNRMKLKLHAMNTNALIYVSAKMGIV